MPPYTRTVTIAGVSKNIMAGNVSESPGEAASIKLNLLRTDATAVVIDDQVVVTITDDYDNEAISRTWVGYVQEKKTQVDLTEVVAIGSEFWLGKRLIKSVHTPADWGQVVKDYIDLYATPVTSGGIDVTVGTNVEHEADYTTILALLEDARQNGFRSSVVYRSGGTPEELVFFKEAAQDAGEGFKAATREVRYGGG